MMAVVTGGQWTMLRVTTVCDFSSCAGQALWASRGLPATLQPPGASVYPLVKWGFRVKALDSRRPLEQQLRTQTQAGQPRVGAVTSPLPICGLNFPVKSKFLAASATLTQ